MNTHFISKTLPLIGGLVVLAAVFWLTSEPSGSATHAITTPAQRAPEPSGTDSLRQQARQWEAFGEQLKAQKLGSDQP